MRLCCTLNYNGKLAIMEAIVLTIILIVTLSDNRMIVNKP